MVEEIGLEIEREPLPELGDEVVPDDVHAARNDADQEQRYRKPGERPEGKSRRACKSLREQRRERPPASGSGVAGENGIDEEFARERDERL